LIASLFWLELIQERHLNKQFFAVDLVLLIALSDLDEGMLVVSSWTPHCATQVAMRRAPSPSSHLY